MKRKLHFLRTLFWRERYAMPQRTTLCFRITNDTRNTNGKRWTVFVAKDNWK